MKKRYINPAIEIMRINIPALMTGSVTSVSGAEGLSGGEDWNSGSANSRIGFIFYDED